MILEAKLNEFEIKFSLLQTKTWKFRRKKAFNKYIYFIIIILFEIAYAIFLSNVCLKIIIGIFQNELCNYHWKN